MTTVGIMPFSINNEKNSMRHLLLFLTILATVLLIPNAFAQEHSNIPSWIKNNAEWWATDQIPDSAFLQGIEYLINEGIMVIPSTETSESSESQEVPAWVKNNAGWWATDQIEDADFINGIQYLIKHGIIIVGDNSSCVNDLSKIFGDSISVVQDTCNLHASSEYLELVPFTERTNINSLGFRGPEFSEIKPANTYRIFMVGGSTMFGSGESSDGTTIPGILQKLFDSSTSMQKIEVINAGISGGNSLTEIRLVNDKLVSLSPDLIIVYDGWNDLRADYPVEYTKANWKYACELGKQQNSDVIITLQPIAGFGNKKLTHQETVNSFTGEDHKRLQLIAAKSTSDYMGRELLSLQDDCNVIDLRGTFDDISGPIYWDQGHVSDTGNLLLAEKFYEITNEIIFNKKSTENKFHNVISKYNSPTITSYLLSKIGIDVDYTQIKKQDLDTKNKRDGNYFYLKNQLGGSEKILVGKDLSEVDLSKIDLVGQNLSDANLSGTADNPKDLRKIDFTGTMLRGANLSFTDLSGQDLSGKDLRGINFHSANLENADLSSVILSKQIQIYGCDEDKDLFLNAVANERCGIDIIKNEAIRTDFSDANLKGATISGANPTLNFVDFSGADLSEIEFSDLTFRGCKFNGANFNDNNFQSVSFIQSDFIDANINNSKFVSISFHNVNFQNAKIIDGSFKDVVIIDIVNLSGADLRGTTIDNLYITGNLIRDCKNNEICG